MDGWKEENNQLIKTFVFKNFLDATRWMFDVSEAIEELNHHPEWSNVYNKVMVNLCTHDAGNMVTDKDYDLARLLDSAFANFK
ncbi:MAG: 4a-hydroxytetrahydrobiopterin dehydratase [Bacteroidetes bacterium]|jgi:4a-hydroxytetrahydrobiopterin dehydratase|nr:4a-hydroxytetrahydrobiopterin dehydratase [Bacteroidota bacterium]